MKIKKIEIANNNVLGSITLDFTDNKGNVVDNIILAGENGAGKTYILDLIFQFSNFSLIGAHSKGEVRSFTVEINNEEFEIFKRNKNTHRYFVKGVLNNQIIIRFDTRKGEGWDQVFFSFNDKEKNNIANNGAVFGADKVIRSIFKCIYSEVGINFKPEPISSITSKDIDSDVPQSVRSNVKLPTEISQLIVDIDNLDNSDITNWGKKNPEKPFAECNVSLRLNRFISAFNYMFDKKRFKEVTKEWKIQVLNTAS